LERTAGLRLLVNVTRNFSGDRPETSTAYDWGSVITSRKVGIYFGRTDGNVYAIS
jgi:acid phosphatase class B